MNLSFSSNEQKLKLTENDLFDRIINVKFNIKDKSGKIIDSFVIRSDYEVVDTNNSLYGLSSREVVIRKCTNKPSIKLQYKMITATTGAEIDLFISNFFIFTSDGRHLRNFTADKYTIDSIEIAMGYWGQFQLPDNAVPTEEEYFNIEARYGADKIVIRSVTVVTTDKLPPDSVIHVHGFVGDIISAPVSSSNINDYSSASLYPVATSGKGLESILFEQITRRYKKPYTGTLNGIKALAPIQADKNSGLMSVADAKEHGVKVFLSDKAKNITIPKKLDSKGKEVDSVVYFEAGFTLGQTIARVISSLGKKLEYRITNSGDILVFLTEEAKDIDSLHSFFSDDIYSKTTFSRIYDNKLPAVYNISIDAVATIVCPFFTFIEPFELIEFSSRYSLTTLVSYFANYDPRINTFLALRASISFATVENINEVTITAVSTRGDK